MYIIWNYCKWFKNKWFKKIFFSIFFIIKYISFLNLKKFCPQNFDSDDQWWTIIFESGYIYILYGLKIPSCAEKQKRVNYRKKKKLSLTLSRVTLYHLEYLPYFFIKLNMFQIKIEWFQREFYVYRNVTCYKIPKKCFVLMLYRINIDPR